MSEKRFTLNTDDKGVILIPNSILKDGEEMSEREVVDKLNEQQATIKDLERKLQICSAHLLSDECCLTDGQIRKIIKEMTNE